MKRLNKLALIMISNFGRADGGRETWAYQFLPRLIERNPALKLEIHGLRADDQPDNSAQLQAVFSRSDQARVQLEMHRAKRSWLPLSAQMIALMAKLRSADQTHSADLVLCVGSFIDLICALIAPRFSGVPKAVWLRTIYADEKADRIPSWLQPVVRRIETAVLRRAQLIIANGDDTAAHYRARGLSVEVVKNAVDIDRWRMPPPTLKQPIKVAFIGRLAVGKGINEFVELASRIHEQNGRATIFEFHLCGDGVRSPLIAELASRGLLVDHGSVANEELPNWMVDKDICVALTHAGNPKQSSGAGVSHSLLEQMAAQKVIIAWDNPAFRNVLDTSSAYLVEQGSVDGLLAALNDIAEHPRTALEKASRAFALASRYGYDEHMERFELNSEAVLTECAAQSRGRSN